MKKSYFLLFLFTLIISCSSSDSDNEVIDTPNSTVTVSDLTVTIDENPNDSAVLGQIQATTSSGTLKYSITNQNPVTAMDIDIDTGIISVRNSFLFNFEVNPTLIAVANVTNGEVTERANIEITLSDVYEKYSHIGNITLESQEEVNEFGEENPWGISGILTIKGGDIVDLSPISGIKDIGSLVIKDFDHPMPDITFIQEIKHSLIIEDNSGMVTLEWIPIVEHLERDLVIRNNDQIANLQGLPNQLTIGRDLYIEDNNQIINLQGISSQLTTLRYLYILNNNSLVNLDEIQSITSITKKLFIESNNSLENLNGIQNLASSVSEGISIVNNNALHDLSAFSSTTTIACSIYFEANNNLVNFSGLDNLLEINGNFIIDSHPFIINLDDLSNLQSVNGDIKINHNPQLNNLCGITNLITNGEITGDYIVENNLYNPTQQDIIDGNCSL